MYMILYWENRRWQPWAVVQGRALAQRQAAFLSTEVRAAYLPADAWQTGRLTGLKIFAKRHPVILDAVAPFLETFND